MFKQIGLNTSYQLIGKAVGSCTTLLVTIVLARQFGADGYGDFVKVTTYVGFFFLFADFGLNAIFLQKEHSGTVSPNIDLAPLLAIRILGSVMLTVIAVCLLSLVPQYLSSGYTAAVRLGIVWFAPAIIFQALITTANAVFQKTLRYDLATISIAIGSVATLVVLAVTWSAHIPTGLIGALVLLSGSAVTAGVAMWFTGRLTPLSLTFTPGAMQSLFVSAIPLGLTLISNVVYSHADSVILTMTRSTAEVGTYGLSYRLFETILVFPTFFMNAMYPVLLKQRSYSRAFLSLLRKTFLFLFISSFAIGALVWIVAPLLTYLKADFASSIGYLRILSLGFPIFFVSSLVMWVLITLKKQWVLAWIYFVGMVINIVLNFWLAPRYGAVASAWITLVSETAILGVSGSVLLRYIQTNKQLTVNS